MGVGNLKVFEIKQAKQRAGMDEQGSSSRA